MSKVRRTTVAALAALVLASPAVTACGKPLPSTCDTFSLSVTGGGKGGGKSGKSSTTKTKPKTTVKEPKRGSGGAIVVDADPVTLADDDCDDD